MTPLKPYLVRSIYEWIIDNGLTPYILVDATAEGVIVPLAHVADEKIILNAHPDAVQNWLLGNDALSFSARFSGRSENLYIPIAAILASYAKENGKGMMFDERFDDELPPEPIPPKSPKKATTPFLKVVK